MDIKTARQLSYSFFSNHPLMTLATVNDEGMAETAAVYVYVDSNYNLYFITREQTRKCKNIQARGMATLSVHDESLLMFGEIKGYGRFMEDGDYKNVIVSRLQALVQSRKAEQWIPPVSQLDAGLYVVACIEPHSIRFSNFSTSSSEEAAVPVEVVLTKDDLLSES